MLAPNTTFESYIHSSKKQIVSACETPVPYNAKVRSQETPGVTGKFDLGVQNEQGKG